MFHLGLLELMKQGHDRDPVPLLQYKLQKGSMFLLLLYP